uniref:Uncharacterized protein n=1 Tax=Esox lucius TaxID=8010 RepID=A0AAY5KW42_ESOLU
MPTSCQPTSCQPTSCQPTSCQPTSCQPTSCQPTSCQPTSCQPTSCQPTKFLLSKLVLHLCENGEPICYKHLSTAEHNTFFVCLSIFPVTLQQTYGEQYAWKCIKIVL